MLKVNEIIKTRFVKNVLMMAGGTVFAQILGILMTPIITRIFTPEQYGILTVYTSLLALFAGSQSLRYELAIPIADDDESAINVLALSFLILVISSTIFLTLFLFASEIILSVFSAESLFEYRLLIPTGFLLSGAYQIFMIWNLRELAYKDISKTKITQSISSNIAKIGLGLLGLGPVGLILGKIIGDSAGITTLSRDLIKEERELIKKISHVKVMDSAKRYKNFPIFQLPSTLLSRFAEQIPILFIASIYSGKAVGLYGFAQGIVSLPMFLIGNSVGDVFYSEASSIGKQNPQKLKTLSNSVFKKLFFVGLAPLIVLVFFSPSLFGLVFGDNWYEAGEYARILSFLSFAQLIFQPVSRIYDIFEKQKESLIITIVRVVLVFAIFSVSKMMGISYIFSISLYVLAMILIFGVTYLYAQKIINVEIDNKNREN